MANKVVDSLKRLYQGKKVLVVGLGLQAGGAGIAKFFAELGAIVTVTDKKDEKTLSQSVDKLRNLSIVFHLGGHELADFLSADLIFKGPSVPWTMPEIVEAEKKGIPIEMEMSFVDQYFPGKLIGITGTRGKSTTASMIFELLKISEFPVMLGGGLPGISNINYLKTASEKDYLVAELSSWALSGFHRKKISPHIGVLTNFYPDHLNYYKNMEDYFFDKKAVFMYQKPNDYLIVNKKLLGSIGQAQSKVIAFDKDDFPEKLKFLRGDHNLENAAAALKIAGVLGIDQNKAVEIIDKFQGLSNRQEIIGKKNNVTFINDTTSTTPIATIKAIDCFSDKPIFLILGGNAKKLPFEQLIDRLQLVKKIILLTGSFTEEILPILKEKFPDLLLGPYNNLDQAVEQGYQSARKHNQEIYLLFSPAATSFATFNNEFHRGNEFNRIVKKILTS